MQSIPTQPPSDTFWESYGNLQKRDSLPDEVGVRNFSGKVPRENAVTLFIQLEYFDLYKFLIVNSFSPRACIRWMKSGVTLKIRI